MARYQNNFDLIRLFAAMQVIYSHAGEWLHLQQPRDVTFLLFLFPGVAVFFVVSGFLVTKSFLDNDGAVVRFAIRRMLRIYPGLWVNFVGILVLLWIAGAYTLADVATWQFVKFQAAQFVFGSDVFGDLLIGSVYDFGGFYSRYPSGVLWTLTVELGFYAFVPVVFCGFARRRGLINVAMLVAFIASFATAIWCGHLLEVAPDDRFTGLLEYGPFAYFWIFLLGAAAYVNWGRIKHLFEGRFTAWMLLYLVVAVIAEYRFGVSTTEYRTADPVAVTKTILLAGCVIAFAHSYTGLARPLRGNDLSYGLYLYHMPLIWTLIGFDITSHWALWFVAYGGAFALAALSWFLVEKPFHKMKVGLYNQACIERDTAPGLSRTAPPATAS